MKISPATIASLLAASAASAASAFSPLAFWSPPGQSADGAAAAAVPSYSAARTGHSMISSTTSYLESMSSTSTSTTSYTAAPAPPMAPASGPSQPTTAPALVAYDVRSKQDEANGASDSVPYEWRDKSMPYEGFAGQNGVPLSSSSLSSYRTTYVAPVVPVLPDLPPLQRAEMQRAEVHVPHEWRDKYVPYEAFMGENTNPRPRRTRAHAALPDAADVPSLSSSPTAAMALLDAYEEEFGAAPAPEPPHQQWRAIGRDRYETVPDDQIGIRKPSADAPARFFVSSDMEARAVAPKESDGYGGVEGGRKWTRIT